QGGSTEPDLAGQETRVRLGRFRGVRSGAVPARLPTEATLLPLDVVGTLPPMTSDDNTQPVVEIHVRPDGSYKVYGPVRVVDVDGAEYDLAPRRKTDKIGERIKLCRCGSSKTMPFCDDSHVETGFSSQPRVADLQ